MIARWLGEFAYALIIADELGPLTRPTISGVAPEW